MQWLRSSFVRRARRLLPALVLLVPACDFHCGGGPPKKAAQHISDSGPGRVEMVRNGSEPRVKLSVGRWTGLRYHMELTSSGSFGVTGRPPLRPPATVATLGLTVIRGTANPVPCGGRHCVEERAVFESLRVKGGGLPPELAAKTNQALAVIDGTTMRQLVTDDGEIAEMKTELVGGKKPDPQVQKTLDQVWDSQRHFPFRLPPVPVGVGASWRFTEPTELRGVRAMQLADMTIVGMDERSVRIRIRLHQQAPRQELENPLDPSSTAILERYRGDGQGELTIDRETAVMLRAHLAITASLRLSALDEQGHKKQVTFVAATLMQARGSIGAPEAGASRADAGTDGAAEAAVADGGTAP
jgi:hypothetical protein